MTVVPVTSAAAAAAEVSWIAALCPGDDACLDAPDGALRFGSKHCRDIPPVAERQGFRNSLGPLPWQIGQDRLSVLAGCTPLTDKIDGLAGSSGQATGRIKAFHKIGDAAKVTMDRHTGFELYTESLGHEVP